MENKPASDTERLFTTAIARSTVFIFLAWVAMAMPLPYSLASGLLGAFALVYVVRMAYYAWRLGRRFGAIFTAVVGIPACLLLVAVSALSAVFYQPMLADQECRANAITETALTQCDKQRESSIMDVFRGR
ncbi:hypothetical protein ACUH9Y_01705 [Dermabacteraceae bacterium P13115]